MWSIDEQLEMISKGAEEIIEEKDLREKLERAQRENRSLIVKLGLDPSAPDIHLGHAVVLRKIKQLQDMGHKAVIIIGDFTGMIGDPTGRSKTRKQLTAEQVMENAKTYERQIFKILDREKTELRFNSEWLSKLNFKEVIELCSKYTVARMLEREDFKNRFAAHESIGIHEFFYPLMQAYDSVEIKADIELGGTDQRFNILMGRTLQREFKQETQIALFMPLLEGLDGVEKMSKSLGNYIGINESPSEIFKKAMEIPDHLIIKYFNLATDFHPSEVREIEKRLNSGENPRDIKIELSKELVRLYHGEEEAKHACEEFIEVFQKGKLPQEVEEKDFSEEELRTLTLVEVLCAAKLVTSNSEAKRLIAQGGVKVNGERREEFTFTGFSSGDIIQAGKKRFVKLVTKC